jgi:hypothetical protein
MMLQDQLPAGANVEIREMSFGRRLRAVKANVSRQIHPLRSERGTAGINPAARFGICCSLRDFWIFR